jgi:hypothetical protein
MGEPPSAIKTLERSDRTLTGARRLVPLVALVLAGAIAASLETGPDATQARARATLAFPVFDPNPYQLPGGGNSGSGAPANDTTKPVIVIPARVNSQIVARRDGVFVFVVGPFGEDVAGTLLFATARPISASRKRILVLARKALSIRAGKRLKVKVKLSKKGRRTLRRRKRLRVRAQVAALDAALNRSDRSFTFTLKAAKAKRKP